MKVDIIEDEIVDYGEPIFSILLKDQTTGRNIIWGTSDYKDLGEFYRDNEEINSNLITGIHRRVIQPRITKSKMNQSSRTKEKAEVFTPSWICNEQNNLIDEQWFNRKNVFNIQLHKSWKVNYEKIEFPNIKGKTWKDYIDARRMELSCGEAPYLVSRYDTITGETIKIQRRIGLLDRKLRVINENVDDEINWLKWTERAFQSIYAYEYQGDNLLLARENLLYTFVENLNHKFNRKPTFKELKSIATIISWNIWQMDGITNTVPLCDKRKWMEQISIFDSLEDIPDRKYCKIKDWRSKVIVEYRLLLEGGK
ncbi:restriction endonuclease subunit M [Bacillus sp. UMB0899]|nr:restriction endonuclease subunit M [Bacillus sp. UMB0899]